MSATQAPNHLSNSFFSASLADADPDIARAISLELGRQRDEIELIASENIVSRAVLEAQGSVLTNKYAEGYPGRRYYGGCQFVDIAEELAIERAKRLFGCGFANVQPNSGSQANQAVFMALMRPGDTFMGLDLACGGHLTHGSPVNMSGKWFNVVSYKVRPDDQLIDMDEVATLAREHKPKVIVAGGSAYSRFWDFARFREIADEVGAAFMVDIAHFAGLVAGGAHPSPFPHAHVVTTTTHKTLRGPRGGMILTNDADLAKKINSAIFPGLQGGPLMHVIAAKAVALGEALAPRVQALCPRRRRERQGARRHPGVGRLRHRGGRHRQPPDAGRPAPEGAHRQGGGSVARAGAHHLQQERRAVRSREADRDLGHPPRHPGGDLPGLRRRRVPAGRRTHRRDPRRARAERRRRQRRRRGQRQGARTRPDPPFPDLRLTTRESVMRCPYCGSLDTQVKDSRPTDDASAIRRRRICPDCGGRFTTFERVQLRELFVVKRSGRRVPFDRDKLQRSVEVALRKRPVEPERVERMINGIVRQLESMSDGEVPSEAVGELVMEGLKGLDDVAYVRFASVYKDFREAKDFEAIVGQLAGEPAAAAGKPSRRRKSSPAP